MYEVTMDEKNIWRNISVGKYHAVLSSNNDHAWSLGFGASGQLGIPLYSIANMKNKVEGYGCYNVII